MVVRVVLALLLALTACSSGPPEADPHRQRLDDVDALVRLVESHPEPFATTDETAWRRSVAELRATARNLSPDEYLFAIARLANLGDRNGHGGVFPTDQPDLPMWPVRLYEFADGWHVVAAADPTLVGARLEAVAGRPVREVVRRLAPAVPRDNPHTLRARVASHLVTPAFLRAVGAYGPLRLVDKYGLRREVTPAEAPAAEYARLAGLDVPQVPPPLPRPPWAPMDDDWFWVQRHEGALVVGYERVAEEDQSAHRVSWLVGEVERHLAARRPRALVLDARRNPGGDVAAFEPLRILLRDVARDLPVRVLVSRATYSAAVIGLLDLRRTAPSVRFYGEPTGGGAVAYGNPRREALPGSGIVVQVGGSRAAAQGSAVAALVPDVRVDVPWRAFAAGADPVLAAALR